MLNAAQRTRQQTFFLILMLGTLETITPFSIDMYLPAFPKIAGDLHTSVKNVSLSVSTYFLGFALGQILYGPLLDRFGRKFPLYFGLVLYIIATISCAASSSIEFLLIIRFIQALGGCAASVASVTMVQDFFPPEKRASVISFLMLVIALSPLLAPTAGSLVVSFFSWHYVFILLAAIVVIIMIIAFFFLPQAKPADKTISLKPKPIIRVFKSILSEPQFYVFALAGTFSFSSLFIYVAGSPSVFMDGFHLTAKQYGGVFALLSVGLIGGSQLNHWFTRKFSNTQIFKTVLAIEVITSTLFTIGVINNWLSLSAHIVFLFIILLCIGLGYPNSVTIALLPFPKNTGSASALSGFLQIGIGGAISSAVGLIPGRGSFAMAITMSVSSTIALLIFWLGQKHVGNIKLANMAT